MTDEEKIEEIKHKVFRHPDADSLLIKRIPKEAVKQFKQFANEHFVGDYGFAFKWMVDNLLVEDSRFIELYAILEKHEERLNSLQNVKDQPPFKRMLSGRKIVVSPIE